MTYNAIAAAAVDTDLKKRVAACFAQETEGFEQPEALAQLHMWRIVANPAISDAYNYALLTNNSAPGKDEAVVTDQMILSAVNAIIHPNV
jgi:hypothetical protein